jgi:hypothetical protein
MIYPLWMLRLCWALCPRASRQDGVLSWTLLGVCVMCPMMFLSPGGAGSAASACTGLHRLVPAVSAGSLAPRGGPGVATVNVATGSAPWTGTPDPGSIGQASVALVPGSEPQVWEVPPLPPGDVSLDGLGGVELVYGRGEGQTKPVRHETDHTVHHGQGPMAGRRPVDATGGTHE